MFRRDRVETIASRSHGGRRGRWCTMGWTGDGRGGDDGDEDVGAPQWEDRRVPCARLDLLDRINAGAPCHDGRRDGRRTGDGRADGVVVRERRIGVGGSGGLRALTVSTAGVEGV